jgi:hypothetical protein
MFTILIMPKVKDKSLKQRSDTLWLCLTLDGILLAIVLHNCSFNSIQI